MSGKAKINRRKFIGASAAAIGITIVPRYVLGGRGYVPPSDKITVGYIGTGTQGTRVMMDFLRKPEFQIVSVCDVNRDSQDYVEWGDNEIRDKVRLFLDEPAWGKNNTGCRAGREMAREIVDTYYRKNREANTYKSCSVYSDFRELLAGEKDLDSVAILTPEHLHATIAIAAMKNGKHSITHKPVSNILSEVRLASNIAAQSGVATQMFCSAGKHTTPLISEWIQAGAIGQVREVHNWSSRPFWPQGMTAYPTEQVDIPDGFDWDLWLGPAVYRPYHPTYTHAAFRGWYDFGTGALGDMGHYSFYQIFKILKLGVPLSVEASRSQYWHIANCRWAKQINNVSYPRASNIHWQFPGRDGMSPVSLHWYDGGLRPAIPEELEADGRKMPEEGMLLVGDKGKILADFSGDSPRLIPESAMKAFERPDKTLPRPQDELDQWIGACRGEAPSDARFEVVRNINETICLGTIALRTDEKLMWDAQNMEITNNSGANDLLRREYRSGWELEI